MATGNHRRLVRCVEGRAALEEKTVRDDFLEALLLFVAAPPQRTPPGVPAEGGERSCPSSSVLRLDAPSAEPLISSAWMDAEECSAGAGFRLSGLSASPSAAPPSSTGCWTSLRSTPCSPLPFHPSNSSGTSPLPRRRPPFPSASPALSHSPVQPWVDP